MRSLISIASPDNSYIEIVTETTGDGITVSIFNEEEEMDSISWTWEEIEGDTGVGNADATDNA